MSESIDWPVIRPPQHRRRFLIILILAVLVGVVFGFRTALSYYIDALWFGSLGYGDVFWTTLRVQWVVFTAFVVATFLILYGSFLALKRTHLPNLQSSHTIFIAGQPVKLPVEPVLRLLGLGVSLAVAAATGASMMLEWSTLALYAYAPRPTGELVDPIFSKPLSFYLFTLPAWQLLLGWLMTVAVIICVVAIFFIFITSGTRALTWRRGAYYTPFPWRGFSSAFAFLLLILAMRVYVGRFDRLFDDHTVFSGVTYTDAHITLAGMLVLCVALFLGA